METTKIILCGRRCVGKTTLYWDLQKALNWPMFSVSEYLRSIIHRHNLKSQEQIDAKNTEISNDLNDRIDNLLTTSDHIIIDTRFYYRIQEKFGSTLKILLTASEKVRLERAAYREGTSVEIQRKRLIKKEDEWIAKMSKIYPFDFFDPKNFDLVIDTGNLTPKQVNETVIEVVRRKL